MCVCCCIVVLLAIVLYCMLDVVCWMKSDWKSKEMIIFTFEMLLYKSNSGWSTLCNCIWGRMITSFNVLIYSFKYSLGAPLRLWFGGENGSYKAIALHTYRDRRCVSQNCLAAKNNCSGHTDKKCERRQSTAKRVNWSSSFKAIFSHKKSTCLSGIVKLLWSCEHRMPRSIQQTHWLDLVILALIRIFCPQVLCLEKKARERNVYIQNHQFSPRLLAIISAPFVVVVVTLLINYSWWLLLLSVIVLLLLFLFVYMSFVYTVAAKWWKNCCFFLSWILLESTVVVFSECYCCCCCYSRCCDEIARSTSTDNFLSLFVCLLFVVIVVAEMKSVWEIFSSILGDALCVATKVKAKSCLASFLRDWLCAVCWLTDVEWLKVTSTTVAADSHVSLVVPPWQGISTARLSTETIGELCQQLSKSSRLWFIFAMGDDRCWTS